MRDTTFVTIRDLTDNVAPNIRSDVDSMGIGNGSCSLSNMKTSCFASELCQHTNGLGPSRPFGSSMWHSKYKYVALHNNRAVGVVCALPTSTFSYIDDDGGYSISNLCVLNEYRSHGVGRQLLNHILRQMHGERIYISVLYSDAASRRDIQSVMTPRAAQLVDLYTRSGFKHLYDKSNYGVFRYSR